MANKTKQMILVSLIFFSCLLYLPILFRDFSALGIAQFLGLSGMQLLWWQVVMGNRPINRLFGEDLIAINNIHKFLGKYGFLVVLAHPMFMTVSYGTSLIFPPIDLSSTFGRYVFLGKTALTFLTITWFISAFYRTKLTWVWWKRIHLIPYFALPLLFLHSINLGRDVQSGFYKNWILFLAGSFILILTLRIIDWSGALKLKYKVIKTSTVAKDVTRFQLKPISDFIKPKRGQFAYFQMKRFSKNHPFTVSHFNSDTGEISFSIKAVGPYSKQLTELKTGDTVFIEGPFGVFTQELENKKQPVVMIAGGIGITPFIRWFESKKVDYLFRGAQTAKDIAYPETAKQSAAQIYNVLSNEQKTGYENGYVTVELIKSKISGKLQDYDFFICGPPPMMEKLIDDLIKYAVPKNQIYIEKFSL